MTILRSFGFQDGLANPIPIMGSGLYLEGMIIDKDLDLLFLMSYRRNPQ